MDTIDNRPITTVMTKEVPYAWDSLGYASELLIMDIRVPAELSKVGGLRATSKAIKATIYHHTLPPTVYSQYDCSGRPFGSNFKKLDFSESEEGYKAIYLHSWAIDI